MRSSNRGICTAAKKGTVEISNGRKASRAISVKKQSKNPPPLPVSGDKDDASALDRLLHIRSDLSQLLGRIDDLVSKASEHKRFSIIATQDIESFENVVSSLKPWASRLEKAFGIVAHQVDQPTETKALSCSNKNANIAPNNKDGPDMDLIVSPSPLVSWHAGAGGGTFKQESGRELFLLTPLPKPRILSSECPITSKSMVRILHDEDHHLQLHPALSKESHHGTSGRLEPDLMQRKVLPPWVKGAKDITSESTLGSLLQHPNSKNRSVSLVRSTSYLNNPTKVCPSLDIIPDNISDQTKKDSGCSDDLASDEVSRSVASRYQELLGLKHTHNSFTTRIEEDNATLDWFLSPPKTCVLMEPTDEKPVPTPANSFGVMLATPLWMNVESTVLKGNQPGENTLKKELWTRFEQVSTDGMKYNASKFQKNTRKGFLDMLEEASCETADPECRVTGKQ